MLTSNITTIGEWINKYGSIRESNAWGGVMPAYPIFMFIGIIAVIVATIIKMRMKKIPLNELYWAIVIVVPVGIIGGSIFGKAFTPGMKWYQTLEFWEPGMSLFGAIGLGTVGGFAWFYRRSKVTEISVWVYADCILPNILLGQAIGRWGNFYNQEILGRTVDVSQLQWLIPGIRDRLFYWAPFNGTNGAFTKWFDALDKSGLDNDQIAALKSTIQDQITNVFYNLHHTEITLSDLTITDPFKWSPSSDNVTALNQILNDDSLIVYREPLFLYESLANIVLWLILTFIVPNLSRWIQPKGKYPWDITPNAYPGWYNPKVKVLGYDEIESWSVQRPIRYKKSEDGLYTISLWEAWNKAYYLYEPNEKVINKLVKNQDKRSEEKLKIEENLNSVKEKHKSDVYRLQEIFNRKSKSFSKQDVRYTKLHNEYLLDVKNVNTEYKKEKKSLLKQRGGFSRYFRSNPDAAMLEKINNPHHFFILRSGVLSGAYILGYMIIRIILETHRQPEYYFVQNYVVPDFIVLGIILASGLFIILWTTFVSPYKYREVGWLYEKSY